MYRDNILNRGEIFKVIQEMNSTDVKLFDFNTEIEWKNYFTNYIEAKEQKMFNKGKTMMKAAL